MTHSSADDHPEREGQLMPNAGKILMMTGLREVSMPYIGRSRVASVDRT